SLRCTRLRWSVVRRWSWTEKSHLDGPGVEVSQADRRLATNLNVSRYLAFVWAPVKGNVRQPTAANFPARTWKSRRSVRAGTISRSVTEISVWQSSLVITSKSSDRREGSSSLGT